LALLDPQLEEAIVRTKTNLKAGYCANGKHFPEVIITA
jgi:hypothetical protein